MKQSTILKIFIIVCTLQSYIPLVYGNGIAAIDSGINDSHLFDYLIKAHMIQSMLKEIRP